MTFSCHAAATPYTTVKLSPEEVNLDLSCAD